MLFIIDWEILAIFFSNITFDVSVFSASWHSHEAHVGVFDGVTRVSEADIFFTALTPFIFVFIYFFSFLRLGNPK